MHFHRIFLFSLCALAALAKSEPVQTPAAANSLAPNLCTVGDGFALSWIERKADKSASLRVAVWNGKSFWLTTASRLC